MEGVFMIDINVRKQGGAAVLTIPADIMKLLKIQVGAKLTLDVVEGELIIRTKKSNARRRYTLSELLVGATPKNMRELNKATEWAREGSSVGREL